MRAIYIGLMMLVLAGCAQQSAWGPTTRSVSIDDLRAVAPQGQLTGIANPVAYRLAMDIDPRESRFSGVVEIDVMLETAVTGIWLHGDDLDVSSVHVRAGNETKDATWTEVLETGVVWVGFPQRARIDGVTLTIAYSAAFDANLAGLFRVDEQGNAYALAKSESIQARRFMPGFDEPGFKAPFDVTLTIPEGMAVIANTPEVSRETVSEGFERVKFDRTRPLSTYLLSVAVGNFDKVVRADIPPNDVRDTPIPLTGYARAGKGAEMEYVLSITPEFVRIFEEAFRQPYPYKKLDIVAAPQWPSGATELAGAITYRESRILMGANAGPAFQRGLKEIHAHEISHMWFGNLVTPPWWDDLWLKEGFASWGTPMALSVFEPEAGHDIQAVSSAIAAMKLDSLSSARAVFEPITRNDNIRNAYDAITYRKGMAVIAMADSYFGADVFRPALGQYIETFADADADSRDFFKVIGKATDTPELTEAFESFVTQNGVPLVEIETRCEAPVAHVKMYQSRYVPIGSSITPDRQWTIPLCLSAGYGETVVKQCKMVRGERETIALPREGCPDWVMPNAGGTGYYRFTQSPDGWERLIGHVAKLPAAEALVTLDSAIAAHQAGGLGIAVLRKALGAGAMHDDPRVIGGALKAQDDLVARLPAGPARDAAKREMQTLLDAVRARISDDPNMGDLLNQMDVFEATTLENAALRTALLAQLDVFLGDRSAGAGIGVLSSDLYMAALTVSMAERGSAGFDRVLRARTEIDDPVFEQAVAGALGSVTSAPLMTRVHELILSGELGPRETYTLAQMQMMQEEARVPMWQFLQNNFPVFLESIPAQWRRRTPRLAASFCETERLAQLEALFDAHGTRAAGYERALNETREMVQLCAALKTETEADLVAAFLE